MVVMLVVVLVAAAVEPEQQVQPEQVAVQVALVEQTQ
jgi:hypothetical protein